jgi:hypothetical protein
MEQNWGVEEYPMNPAATTQISMPAMRTPGIQPFKPFMSAALAPVCDGDV